MNSVRRFGIEPQGWAGDLLEIFMGEHPGSGEHVWKVRFWNEGTLGPITTLTVEQPVALALMDALDEEHVEYAPRFTLGGPPASGSAQAS